MKKILLIPLTVIASLAFSQNTFPTSGNVGIGTSSPSSFGTSQPTLDLRGSSLFRTGSIMGFSSDLSIGWSIGRADDSSLPDGLVISTSDAAPINFRTGANTRFTINGNGNVGIGTTNPTEKLTIEKDGNSLIKMVNTSSSYGSTMKIGPVSSNGYKETQFQYEDRFGLFDSSSSSWRFVIRDNGNVGIGTSNPLKKLEVRGDVVLEASKNPAIFTGTTSGELNRYLTLLNSPSHSSASGLKAGGVLISDSYNYANPGKNDLIVKGNVGIGTSTPAAKLDIEGGDLYVGEESSSNGQRRLIRVFGYDNNSQFNGTIHSNWEDGKRTFDIYTSASTQQIKIDASANPTGRIAILPGTSAGVGIGTLQTGTHKLAVEGTIGAREIKVEATGWSDFVFYNDYNLPSLEEVEKYITENNHLPEIPSEAEVLEEGINLGEMNAKLLQKIEELTLYLIEQNKRIITLEEKLADK